MPEPIDAAAEPREYAHVWQAFTETPWAILPSTLQSMMQVLSLHTEGRRFTAEEIRERLQAANPGPRSGARQQGSIAVIPVYGTISQRMGAMAATSGGTSTQAIGAAVRQAVADPQIGAVVLDVDSPGGSVFGVQELADELLSLRGQDTPIVAVANSMAASAAYWIASAADELVVTPSGQVGSIGVIAVHQDESAALDQAGIKTTIISAGKYKSEGHPTQPLSDEGRAAMQEMADAYYEAFVSGVAKARGTTPAAVRSGYGEGRVVNAKTALDLGMVDRIDTLDNTISRLMKRRPVSAGAGPQRAAVDDTLDLRRRRLRIVHTNR